MLDRFSRFVRLYEIGLRPRKKGPAPLPLSGKNYSLEDALQVSIDADKASVTAPNNDTIELVSVAYDKTRKTLNLLFHRASPGAAEPSYRKLKKAGGKKQITVRHGTKDDDEDQSYSAHFVIRDPAKAEGVFLAALEEVPGISIGTIREIIAAALQEYRVDFVRDNKSQDTYFSFKPTGVKSETLSGALKRGGASFVTLSRPAQADFVDGDETFKAERETMRLRIVGELNDGNWAQHFKRMLTLAKERGWEDGTIDLNLDTGKRKTVKLDREEAAKEVLFVLAEQVNVGKALLPCSTVVVDELVDAMRKVIASSLKAAG